MHWPKINVNMAIDKIIQKNEILHRIYLYRTGTKLHISKNVYYLNIYAFSR